MKKYIALLLLIFLVTFTFAQHTDTCIIQTSLGNITIVLYPAKAPVTVANFLKYVDAHLYDSTSFFRSVRLNNQPSDSIKIEVIQASGADSTKDFAPILLESTRQTGLHHRNGTVSMARSAPNSATSSFSICINDQPSLDYGGKRNKDGQGFAAFGRVIKGMDVVRKIQNLYPEQGQYFSPPVLILRVRRKG
ncbi:MAG: peptidylprolyl isomerase [Bacteroidota bacterium]|nr:peptidylprolyl isomerase [Bacteroidota bacterium]